MKLIKKSPKKPKSPIFNLFEFFKKRNLNNDPYPIIETKDKKVKVTNNISIIFFY